MNVNDKLKDAKVTNWLCDGLTPKEIHETKKLALISAKIQLKRSALGMTQKEFARYMGVTQGMISKWESGEYNFTLLSLDNICNKLNLCFFPVIRDKDDPAITCHTQL